MPSSVDGKRARLTFFGGPTVRGLEGRDIPLTPSHQRILTLVWCYSPRGIPRSIAIRLLWGAEDGARARHRLRQALHDLGARLGFRPLASDGEDLLLPATDAMTSDLEDFQDALAQGRLQEALTLLRAGFVPLLDGRDLHDAFDDWLSARRESLRRKLHEAGAWQWDRFRPVGGWEQALDAAEVLAALDPTSESAACRLIEARAMTGNPEAAELAITGLLDRLPQGTGPAPETLELIERVRRLDPAPVMTDFTGPPPPPLVGRRQSLAAARRMLGRVGEGSFEVLLIVGEGGSGKTRLMEEVWKEANLGGFRCLDAHPVEVERRIPLNPLVDMMQDPGVIKHIGALEEPWRSVIASLLPTLPEDMAPPVVPPIAESSLSRRLFDAFATLFTAMTEEEPVLFFIDDLHWADTTTVAVLQFVQRRWRGGSLGIVATVRPELVSPGDATSKYLSETADLPVTLVELGELSDQEALTLVELAAGRALDPAAAARLCALGGRNPFFLVELTRDYLAGKVHLPELPTDAITLPISIRQLVDPRIQALGEEAAVAAAYLSVWGRPLGLAPFAGLMGVSNSSCAARTEELERCRLATVDKGKIRLRHGLIRSAIYHGLSASRRAYLHGEVAAYLETESPTPHGELAIHFDRAGQGERAAVHGRHAADRALESGAMAEAAYFLQLVVDNESDATRKAEATADLARVLHMNREIMRANPLLELAATRLRAVGNHARALRMDIRRVEGLAELGAAPLTELLDRLATIKEAARAARDDEALAFALDSEVHLLHRSGEVEAIQSLFGEIQVVASSSDPAASALANASLALNVLFGDPEEALRCARKAVRAAEAGGAGEHTLLAYSRLILVLIYLGQLDAPEGLAIVSKAEQLAKSSGDLKLKAYLTINKGVFLMEYGHFEQAEHSFELAARLLERTEPGLPHVTLHCNRGELYVRRREYQEASEAFQIARNLSAESTPTFIAGLISAGLGICALELGDLAQARECESAIPANPSSWYFDPTLLFDFRLRLLSRRAQARSVIAEIEEIAPTLATRLPVAAGKLRDLVARHGPKPRGRS